MERDILKRAVDAAKKVVDEEIEKLIEQFIEKLKNKPWAILDNGEEVWARKIANVAFKSGYEQKEGRIKIKGTEDIELKELENLAKALMYLKLEDTIKELQEKFPSKKQARSIL